MTDARLRLALAGGGTGGHMVPGLALLDELAEQGQTPEHLVWFQSGRPVELSVLAQLEQRLGEGCTVERVTLELEPLGGGAPSPARTLRRLVPEVLRARRALRRARSQVVVGLGGFTSAPAGLAARSLGIPLALLEINAAPGRATRLLGPLAKEVWHAVEATCPEGRSAGRHRVTGAPVSPRFARAATPSRAAREALGLAPGAPVLAVLGGSQGAGGLNAFLRAITPRLSAAGVQVVHQVGPGRLDESADDSRGYTAKEYIEDVPALLAAADLVLCRGGASTLAEVGAVGVPSWVVPYPHHADQHQAHNARALGDGTRVVPEDQLEASGEELLHLLSADGAAQLARMRAHLGSQVPADAARTQCERLRRLAGLA